MPVEVLLGVVPGEVPLGLVPELLGGGTTSIDPEPEAPVARSVTVTLYVPNGAFPAALENV